MTTFFFEAPLLIEPRGALKVGGAFKPVRPFDLYHNNPPMVVCGALGVSGDVSSSSSAPAGMLNYVQTWRPVTPTFDLAQVCVKVTGTLRA